MHILFITEFLPPQIHGIATRFYHHIVLLRQLGHTVHVVGPEYCPLTTIPLFVTPFHVFNPEVKICTISPCVVASILATIPTLDIVHMVCPANPTFHILLPVFYAHNIPVVCSHHCDPSQFTSLLGKAKPLVLEMMRQLYFFSEKFVAIHLVPTKTAENRAFTDSFCAKRFDILPTGIDLQLFHHRNLDLNQKSRCKTLVYVGRLSPEKNCEMMLRFFKRLVSLDGYGDYRLRIIGDGPSIESLMRLSTSISGVEFVGQIPHYLLVKYYRKAQAFVTFSLSEMFGFTNLEALACATPIIYPACEVFDRYYRSDFSETRFDLTDFHSFKRAVDATYRTPKLQQKAIAFCAGKDWYSKTRALSSIYQKIIDGM